MKLPIGATSPAPVRVDITPYSGGWSVSPVWDGVDRPQVGSWVLRSRAVADRLAAAVLAGAVHTHRVVKADVNGATYVAARSLVMGKYANSDLVKLGY